MIAEAEARPGSDPGSNGTGPPAPGVLDELSGALASARSGVAGLLELATLEARRAGLSLVWMAACGFAAAICLVASSFSGNRAAKPTPHGRWRAPGGGRRPRLWVGEQCVAERRSIGSDLNPLPPPAGSRHEQHHLYRGPDRRRIVCRRISWSALASVVWLTILLWRPQQSGAVCSPGLVACFVVGIPPVGEVGGFCHKAEVYSDMKQKTA